MTTRETQLVDRIRAKVPPTMYVPENGVKITRIYQTRSFRNFYYANELYSRSKRQAQQGGLPAPTVGIEFDTTISYSAENVSRGKIIELVMEAKSLTITSLDQIIPHGTNLDALVEEAKGSNSIVTQFSLLLLSLLWLAM